MVHCSCSGHSVAQRLHDFKVLVGDSFDGSTFDELAFTQGGFVSGAVGAGKTQVVTFDNPISGRYVAVKLTQTGILTICEITVSK